MLFYFPAEIKLPDLPSALSHWLDLLDKSPLDAVSLLQISVLGWRGDDRYELKGRGGFAPYMIFDRCYDTQQNALPKWVARLSSNSPENAEGGLGENVAGSFKHAAEEN